MTLCCDMCHKPLKAARFKIATLFGKSGQTMTVGPDCFRKAKKARKAMLEKHTPEQLEAIRARVAAMHQMVP